MIRSVQIRKWTKVTSKIGDVLTNPWPFPWGSKTSCLFDLQGFHDPPEMCHGAAVVVDGHTPMYLLP